MMRNILVPLDGSEFGEQALSRALALAEQAPQVELHLVHVLVHPQPGVTFAIGGGVPAGWEQNWREEGQAYLQSIAERVTARGRVAQTALLEGIVAEVLPKYIDEHGIDLVVMTTHGRGGVSRAWLGSVADQLVRRVGIPILLVRPSKAATAAAVAAALPRHALVPVDGEFSEAALEPAIRLVGGAGTITLLHVLTPTHVLGAPYLSSGMMLDSEVQEAQQQRGDEYLRGVAARISSSVAAVNRLVRTHANAADVIVETARAEDADVIVIATHGRRGMARWAMGSVADKVIRSSETPVLVLPAGRGARSREAASEAAAES